jgi:hypothetical protein
MDGFEQVVATDTEVDASDTGESIVEFVEDPLRVRQDI